jgi:hypothetical protein
VEQAQKSLMPMRGFEIIGTGHHVPGKPVTNDDLSRVMDTNDEWIFRRSGIKQRHYTPEGMGASDLALEASRLAIESAGIRPDEIDYVVFATMTPDYVFPGSGALLADKLGLRDVPALDIRQQCAAMLFGLQIVDGLVKSGAARTILFVGAEAHAGFMPWDDWDALDPATGRRLARTSTARSPSSSVTAPERSSSARRIAGPAFRRSSFIPTAARPSSSTWKEAASGLARTASATTSTSRSTSPRWTAASFSSLP